MRPCRLANLLALFFICVHGSSALIKQKHDKVVACYVASWAYYRKDSGKFEVKDLRPELCTHYIYAFAGISTDTWTIRSLDPWRDVEEGIGNYRRMTELRQKHPELKLSLGIGGWNEGSKNYSDLASSPARRKTFIASVVEFLKTFQFDGFDLDWEFPGKRGGAPYDKENFVSLVKELKDAFRGPRYSLTAAISASKDTIDAAYDLPEISRYLDHIHVMAYDYHGTWDSKVLPNSPLRGKDGLSVEDTVKYLLDKGAPANKLVLGLAMYGRTFVLAAKPDSPNESPIGQRSLDKGFKGPYTGEDGFMGYNEICQELVDHPESWRTGWDDYSSTPYVVKDDRVIVYDNPKSMVSKIEYIKSLNLAGVMVWSIDTDDFRGKCSSLHNDVLDPFNAADYPLMRSINMALVDVQDHEENDLPKENSAEGYCHGFILLLFTSIVHYF